MAYRRRRTYRKKRSYRRRNFRAKYRRGYKRSGNNKVYYFTRLAETFSLICQPAVISFGAVTFNLSAVPNFTEFTNLYDMYKVNAVKINCLPQVTQTPSLAAAGHVFASSRFFSAIDRNDASSPTTIDEVREYKSCKYTSIVRPHKRFIMKPKILDRGGTYNPGNPWISTTAPTQDYYGWKYAIEPNLAAPVGNMIYTVEVKYYLAFKNVK